MKAPVTGLLIGLLAIASWTKVTADTLFVGPGHTLTRISDAARVARDGDKILIAAGTYRGDVAVWRQKALTIEGVGGPVILTADGQIAEGKAIWVIRYGRFTIRGIHFIGARAPSGNGAGIRFEGGHLTLTDCTFRDNQMGLLTGNDGKAVLRIRASHFADAPRQQSPLPHLLYVGQIARFEATASRFENGHWGHLIKTRARQTELRNNLIADGPTGKASYEVDIPNGGEATLIGNIIIQGPGTENNALVAYGAEGIKWPSNRLTMTNNTLFNQGSFVASFLRLWPDRQSEPHPTTIETRNNLQIGQGVSLDTLPGHHDGNLVEATPAK